MLTGHDVHEAYAWTALAVVCVTAALVTVGGRGDFPRLTSRPGGALAACLAVALIACWGALRALLR